MAPSSAFFQSSKIASNSIVSEINFATMHTLTSCEASIAKDPRSFFREILHRKTIEHLSPPKIPTSL
jgi:hypothetical protein